MQLAHVVSSTHVAADGFTEARQEVLLVAVGNLLYDAECVHFLLLTDALCDQCKCIVTVYSDGRKPKLTFNPLMSTVAIWAHCTAIKHPVP